MGFGLVFIYTSLNTYPLPAPGWISFLYYSFLLSVSVMIFLTDLREFVIMDAVLYPAIVVSLLYNIIFQFNLLGTYLLAALGGTLFLLILHLVTRRRGMGLGDVKLAVLMGLVLGYPDVVVAFYLAFIGGALFGLGLLLLRKVKPQTRVPFAPFLILASISTIIYKQYLVLFFFRWFYGL